MDININDIKDQFVHDYFSGNQPTLTRYLAKYPNCDFSEFIDFVLEFAILNATPILDLEPSLESYAAMVKGLQKSHEISNLIQHKDEQT